MTRTLEERLAHIEALLQLSREASSALYTLAGERRALELSAAAEIASLFVGAPPGLRHMTLAALSEVGARFALIDLRGRNGGIVNGSRLTVHTFRVAAGGDCPVVCDERSGDVVGALRLHPQGESYDHRVGSVEWHALEYCSPAMHHSAALLPLTGPALEHPAFQRMAAWAEAVLAGTNPTLAAIARIDARVEAAALATERRAAAMRSVALEGFDEEQLDLRHADLVALMRGHDWTWHYADSFLRAAAACEEKIGEALLDLPETEALALWHLHAWSPDGENPWSRARTHALNRRKVGGRRAA